MEDEKSFLGIGWSFPPTFDVKMGAVQMVTEEKDIEQSLKLILFTSYGERTMRPDFGSNLSDSVFDSVDSVTINTIQDNITQSVVEFEPRITLHDVIIDSQDIYNGKLNIKLDYTIRTINVRTNIVFPYYFKEGTNITDM
ncbi:MAG: phage baseplate assembly protein W [Marivirga sp.]|jgi:phage baseplate assembly protein W